MRRLLCAILLAPALWCQSTVIFTAKGRLPRDQKDWTMTTRPATIMAVWDCGTHTMDAGQTVTCSIKLNQTAPFGGALITIVVPAGFTAAPSSVTIPEGSDTASVQVTLLDTTGILLPRVFPAAWTISGPGMAPLRYASLTVPCCARVDGCGLPAAKISQLPCQR